MKVIDTDEIDLILIQEPYEYQNRPAGIENTYRTYTAGTGKHRAAIIIRNCNIDAILITKISDEDTVVLELTYGKLKLYAASMYFDIQDQMGKNFNKLDELMTLSPNGKILIGADTNSRSKTWHDVSTNTRGKKLEDFLASSDLLIINEKSEKKTFHNSIGSSNIDLTMVSSNLLADICGWEISTEDSLSDHNYLKYKIRKSSNNSGNQNKYHSIKYIIRDEKKQLFDLNLIQELQKKTDMANNEGGTEEIDNALSTAIATSTNLEQYIDLIEETIKTACRKSFPHSSTNKKNNNHKSVPWWKVELTVMRKRVNANRRLYQRTKNDETLRERRKEVYLKLRREYKTELKKARTSSWKEYCNVIASINPWSQVYKLASGKNRTNNIMTTIKKPDGTETTNLNETLNTILDYILTEEKEIDNLHHQTVWKAIEEPIFNEDDVDFSREEIKNVIDSFNQKKAPGIDGFTGGIYQRMIQLFPRTTTTIYNQCLKRGCFPKKWKVAKVILITKPTKEKSLDPSKYRPISLLNIGGKILEKLLINRINHHLYKHKLLTDKQYGFTPQKNTIDAIMEAKSFIEPVLENRGIVILASLDVQGAFDSAWWPGIIHGLRDLNCPRNLYNLSKEYFNNRTAILTTNNYTIERKITKGTPQGSCCSPAYWNILYNSLLSLELTSHSKAIAFADDLIILTRGETVAEAENYINIELRKIQDWAQNNKMKFNNNKSKVMLMSRRKRKENKEIGVYINNTKLKQVNNIKYLGIVLDNKLTFKEHIIHIEEKCMKLIFSLAKSAKLTWGLKHKALKTIYTGAILPLMTYGAPVWKDVLNKASFKARLVRIQRLMNVKIAKAYRTVSNDALCIITGLMPIHIKIQEVAKYYEINKSKDEQYDRDTEPQNWIHPAKHIAVIEGHEDSTHNIHAYTDGSKNEEGIGAGIAIYANRSLITKLKYRLNDQCSNNQAEQLAILKALEYIQTLKEEEKTALLLTDSRITLQLLQNQKRHTHLIDQIKKKVLDLERLHWKIEFSWIKAHVGHEGNETADRLAKEAARNKNIVECYNKIPKSSITRDLKEKYTKQWQTEWESTIKGSTTRSFFPKIEDRLRLRITPTPNFTTLVTGHGNLKNYLHKYKIIDNPQCNCNKGEQTVEHIIYNCELQDQERDKLKAVVAKTEKWPISKTKLMLKFYKEFKQFTDNIVLNAE
jgi:ribonuclease HI